MALLYADVIPFIQSELQPRVGVAINKWAQSNTANADAPTADLAKAILKASPQATEEYVRQFSRVIVIANMANLNAPYNAASISDAAVSTAIAAAVPLLK